MGKLVRDLQLMAVSSKRCHRQRLQHGSLPIRDVSCLSREIVTAFIDLGLATGGLEQRTPKPHPALRLNERLFGEFRSAVWTVRR
jgi:hypothetical protein